MEFISKLNAKTNLVEGLATETVVVTSIETTSRTNKNGKAFGFVHGTNPQGELLTGIAYAATAAAHGDDVSRGCSYAVQCSHQHV